MGLLGNSSHHRVIHGNGCLEVSIISQSHRQGTRSTIGRQFIFLGRSQRKECLVKKIAPTVIPGIIIYLVKRMIIVGIRITNSLQQFFTDSQRLRIILCQEIITVVRIGIADSDGSLWRLPVHWSNGIEHPLTADRTRRHLCQIVCLPQIVTCQALWLQGAPIAIDLHLRGVRETTSLDELIGELVETRSWHTDLRPGTFTKHGMFCIARRFTFGSCSCLQNRLRLHIEHETHQFLISAVSIHQRHERHIEQSLFAGHTDMLRHCGQRGQRLTTDLFITTDIRFTHIDKLRIGDADGIDRISITRTQRFLPGEDW